MPLSTRRLYLGIAAVVLSCDFEVGRFGRSRSAMASETCRQPAQDRRTRRFRCRQQCPRGACGRNGSECSSGAGSAPKFLVSAQHDDGHGAARLRCGDAASGCRDRLMNFRSATDRVGRHDDQTRQLRCHERTSVEDDCQLVCAISNTQQSGYGCRPARRGEFDIQQWLAE